MMAQNTSDYNCDKCCCDQWHIWFVLCPPAVRGASTQKKSSAVRLARSFSLFLRFARKKLDVVTTMKMYTDLTLTHTGTHTQPARVHIEVRHSA